MCHSYNNEVNSDPYWKQVLRVNDTNGKKFKKCGLSILSHNFYSILFIVFLQYLRSSDKLTKETSGITFLSNASIFIAFYESLLLTT